MENNHCGVKRCFLCDNPEILQNLRQKKEKCSWCGNNIKNQTNLHYERQGNMCNCCITMINKKLEELKLDKEYNKAHPKEKMDMLAEILEDPITEEERIEVVEEMKKEYNHIIHYEVL